MCLEKKMSTIILDGSPGAMKLWEIDEIVANGGKCVLAINTHGGTKQ